MDEENKSEVSLNDKMETDKKVEEIKIEFSELQQKIISSLNLSKGTTILSVSDRIDTIPLGGMLEAHDVYAVKVQDKENKIETILVDKDLKQLANLNEKNQIELSDLTKERFEELIGKKGKQTPRTKRIL